MLTLRWRDHHLPGEYATRRKAFFRDRGAVDVFLGALAEAGLGSGWTTRYDFTPKSDLAWAPLDELSAARRSVVQDFLWIGNGETEVRARVAPSPSFTVFHLAADRLVERVLDLVRRFTAASPKGFVRSPLVAVNASPSPRVRPRRVFAHWPSDAIVMIVDRAHLAYCVAERVPGDQAGAAGEPRYTSRLLEELALLEAGPLPPGATREEQAGQLVFDFTRCGDSPQAAASVFERWMVGQPLLARPHLADNADGDPAIDWSGWREKAPEGSGVTLYDPHGNTTYVADVADLRGESLANPEKLDRLRAVRRAGKLPTGEVVKKAYVVVPVREQAVMLAHLVEPDVVDGVGYPGEEYIHDPNCLGESWWLPFPEAKPETAAVAKRKPAPAKKKAAPPAKKKAAPPAKRKAAPPAKKKKAAPPAKKRR